jgi:hypothetical protein
MVTKTRVFSFITKSVLIITTAGAIVLPFSNKTLSQQSQGYDPKAFIAELHALSNNDLVQEYRYLVNENRRYKTYCSQEPPNIGVLINPKISCVFAQITTNQLIVTQIEFEKRGLQIPQIW